MTFSWIYTNFGRKENWWVTTINVCLYLYLYI